MDNKSLAILVLLLAAGCARAAEREAAAPPMDPTRKVTEKDCIRPVDLPEGNLMCMSPEAAAAEQRRREAEEQKRKLAAERRARAEAEERARLERVRAEQAAREEAARKARAAEEARLAAEQARLAAERMARLERERQEKAEAEARARQRAEQEAREAAERERLRLEEEWLAGRALLERFVTTYGQVEKFKEVSKPINGFLDKTR
jgi:hypothetical protein